MPLPPPSTPIIREEENDATRSRNALMRAQALGLCTFYGVYDLADPDQVQALADTLGPGAVLPEDAGTYDLISVPTDAGWPMQLLVPEGLPALQCALTLAARHSPEYAAQVSYRQGLQPHPPIGSEGEPQQDG